MRYPHIRGTVVAAEWQPSFIHLWLGIGCPDFLRPFEDTPPPSTIVTHKYEYLVNKMAAIRWRGSDLDASYHAALFLMASHPALFQKMDRYLCPEGIDFTKMMRKEEFEYDWMKITADAARNLFSWNSKCAATPFEISRMPAPAIRALFTACFIANGDYMVSVRKNDKGEKVFEIDDSAGKRREAFNLQMEQMMEAPGMEPD